jgi:Pretoxin HINT domain
VRRTGLAAGACLELCLEAGLATAGAFGLIGAADSGDLGTGGGGGDDGGVLGEDDGSSPSVGEPVSEGGGGASGSSAGGGGGDAGDGDPVPNVGTLPDAADPAPAAAPPADAAAAGAPAAAGAEPAAEAGDSTATSQGDDSSSCGACPCSFVGSTPVLLADGATTPINKIKVGDVIQNSVPGLSGTQDHAVTAVETIYTDRDFVQLGIAPVSEAEAGKTPNGSKDTGKNAPAAVPVPVKTKSATGRVVKAGLALTASAALLLSGAGTKATPAGPSSTGTTLAAQTATTTPADSIGGTITTTFLHPFYDETKSSFVEAQYLQVGDLLQTPTGQAQVTTVHLYHADTTTYDLTIGALHTFFVVAGDGSGGGVAVLVHNNDGCPTLQGTYQISAAQKAANVGFRYQEFVTGTDQEQWWMQNGSLTKVDGGPDANGFITEAKWAGNDSPTGWSSSRYNPLNPRTVFNESTTVNQAQRLLDLNGALGGSGVRYAVSSEGGAAFYRALFREWFPDEMADGTLAVYHVPAIGMP